MTRFVLVPGAGGVAWYWHLVAQRLSAAGHEAVPVDLPGDDETAGLADYATLVERAVGHHPDVVLVAQSMGAFIAPLVCGRRTVAGLVLLNAMIPLPGETPDDWWEATGAVEARIAAAEASGYPTQFDLFTYFLHDLPQPLIDEGTAFQRQEAAAAFAEVCAFGRWPDVPTTVLGGTDDRFFPVGFQRRVAAERLGLELEEIPGGHLAALSRPDEVGARLLAARSQLA